MFADLETIVAMTPFCTQFKNRSGHPQKGSLPFNNHVRRFQGQEQSDGEESGSCTR